MLDSLIDATQFLTVRRQLNCSGSPITDVLFVREKHLLAPLAELITCEQPTASQQALFARWIRNGLVKVGINGAMPRDHASVDYLIDVESIPDHATCRVLFLPPYYLVHLRVPVNTAVSEPLRR